jgi:hypothetical protein
VIGVLADQLSLVIAGLAVGFRVVGDGRTESDDRGGRCTRLRAAAGTTVLGCDGQFDTQVDH